MRGILLFVISIWCLSSTNGQAPQTLNYQAVARNSSGGLIANQLVKVQFTILDQTASGNILYRETDTVSTNTFGLFTLAIGSGTFLQGSFTGISWGSGPKFLQVQMDPAGGTNYTDMGTTQLLSVPYALYAETAGNGVSNGESNRIAKFTTPDTLESTDIFDSVGLVGIGTLSPTAKLHIAYSSSGANPNLRLEETLTGAAARVAFNNTGIAEYWEIAGHCSANNPSSTLNFYNSTTGNVMTIIGNGNVGIGTTTPAYALDVVDTGNTLRAQATSSTGIALQVEGAIKVAGTNPAAYVHTITAQNTTGYFSFFSYTNMVATDMLFVTHNYVNAFLTTPVGVLWNGNEWVLFTENGSDFTIGEKFNILIIKQ